MNGERPHDPVERDLKTFNVKVQASHRLCPACWRKRYGPRKLMQRRAGDMERRYSCPHCWVKWRWQRPVS